MTTETMIERMARAIYAEMRFEEDDPWDRVIARSKELGFPAGTLNGNQTRAMFIAHAALQALREPTEEMMRSVEIGHLENCSPDVADGWRKEYRRIFTTAIDAALQEKT